MDNPHALACTDCMRPLEEGVSLSYCCNKQSQASDLKPRFLVSEGSQGQPGRLLLWARSVAGCGGGSLS